MSSLFLQSCCLRMCDSEAELEIAGLLTHRPVGDQRAVVLMCWFLLLKGPSLEREKLEKPSKDLCRWPDQLCFPVFPELSWACVLLLLYPRCGSWNLFSLAFSLFHWSSTRGLITWTDCLSSQSTNSGSISNCSTNPWARQFGDIRGGP